MCIMRERQYFDITLQGCATSKTHDEHMDMYATSMIIPASICSIIQGKIATIYID